MLAAQRVSPPYPPTLSLVNLIVSGPGEMPVVRRVTQLADWCAAMVAKHALAIEILGPAPCPITRIKDR